MNLSSDDVRSLDELREFVHQELCVKENLVIGQFSMSETVLVKRGNPCGLQFVLRGPRSVRLGAIWTVSTNTVYFYSATGERYRKLILSHSLPLKAA